MKVTQTKTISDRKVTVIAQHASVSLSLIRTASDVSVPANIADQFFAALGDETSWVSTETGSLTGVNYKKLKRLVNYTARNTPDFDIRVHVTGGTGCTAKVIALKMPTVTTIDTNTLRSNTYD